MKEFKRVHWLMFIFLYLLGWYLNDSIKITATHHYFVTYESVCGGRSFRNSSVFSSTPEKVSAKEVHDEIIKNLNNDGCVDPKAFIIFFQKERTTRDVKWGK